MRRLTWLLVGAAGLAIALGVLAIVVLVQSTDDGIPVVTDISSSESAGGRIEFSWDDPGLVDGDLYQITVTENGVAEPPTVQSARTFVVDGDPGESVCLTVVVTRGGTAGASSAEKCTDVTED